MRKASGPFVPPLMRNAELSNENDEFDELEKSMKFVQSWEDALSLWNIQGTFGRVEGNVTDRGILTAKGEGWSVTSEIREDESGVFSRRDTFTNVSEQQTLLSALSARFTFDGGEWEVYTQYNGWQNENRGAWHPLTTTVAAEGISARTAVGAAPFLVIWNLQSNRGYAFHLVSYSAWEMKVTRRYAGGGIPAYVEVELGVHKDGLRLSVAPGETVDLPEILYYPVKNRVDIDAYKLHRYYNKHYPRRTQPVMYNTWLYQFDSFTYESLLSQVPLAEKLGAEYFLVDAGWFGIGKNWWNCVGDWEENLTGGLCGHTKDLADAVRAHGMKFGFWLEGERANVESMAPTLHPEYYIREKNEYFLNFGNPEAVEYITKIALSLIDKWGAEMMKMDFNADFIHDKTGGAFTAYGKGFRRFMENIKRARPDFYLESCAAGGCRSTLRDTLVADSYWMSDTHSPTECVRIYKEGLLRLPPQLAERWVTLRSFSDFTPCYPGNSPEKILSSNDACWNEITGVHLSYLLAALTGGPIGFSCDLSKLSPATFEALRAHVAAFKENREFWRTCEARILANTPSVSVLEFTDCDLSQIRIVAIAEKIRQTGLTVYPAVDPAAEYRGSDGTVYSGAALAEEGIRLPLADSHTATFLELFKI